MAWWWQNNCSLDTKLRDGHHLVVGPQLFQAAQRRIKRIQTGPQRGDKSAKALGKNVQASLAGKLADLSTEFRQQQSAYLDRLRGRAERSRTMFAPTAGDALGLGSDEEEGDTYEGVFLDDQQQLVADNERAIAQREREIEQIAKNIAALATIFKDMQTMVVEQGTLLDRIDYNVEQTAVNLETAVQELHKAEKYQHNARNKFVIICLLVGIAICVLIIVGCLSRRLLY